MPVYFILNIITQPPHPAALPTFLPPTPFSLLSLDPFDLPIPPPLPPHPSPFPHPVLFYLLLMFFPLPLSPFLFSSSSPFISSSSSFSSPFLFPSSSSCSSPFLSFSYSPYLSSSPSSSFFSSSSLSSCFSPNSSPCSSSSFFPPHPVHFLSPKPPLSHHHPPLLPPLLRLRRLPLKGRLSADLRALSNGLALTATCGTHSTLLTAKCTWWKNRSLKIISKKLNVRF